MKQTAFRTDPLSPELNHLINDYPCDALDAHQKFFAINAELVGRATVWASYMERQFFPELSSAEPRFATGLDLLEKDQYWITHWIALPARPIILHDKLRG